MGNEDETQTMVANEMIMSLNLSNDYVVTYTKLGNTNENGIEEQRVFASAIQEKTLAGYKQMMKDVYKRQVLLSMVMMLLYMRNQNH